MFKINNEANILIIGDSCIDEFIYCETSRLAPDLPIPILKESYRVTNDGMSMNIFRHLHPFFKKLEIKTNSNWEKIKKTRYVDDLTNHHFIRVDIEHQIEKISSEIDYNKYDAIIISDYNKGFLSETDISNICYQNEFVFLDSKKIIGNWASKAKFIKINEYEYKRSKSHLTPELQKKIIVTLGKNGAFYDGRNYELKSAVSVQDSCGAGDTFLSALFTHYFHTKNIDESIGWANSKAAETVSVRGVVVK